MSKEIQSWADPAMFAAEPLTAAEGPRVYLLEMSSDPLGQIAAACKMYKGEVVRDLADVTTQERVEYLEQVQKTKLKAPFEFVKFHFMIEGVTRSLTHQMVRQRTAAYAQESLRFAVKENLAETVALPPSLASTADWPADWEEDLVRQGGQHLTDREVQRARWDDAVRKTSAVYADLVNSGMPAEDARGLLPHNVTTRLHYTTDLRALQDHAGNRLCTQAQFEWRALWVEIVKAIREYGDRAAPEAVWQYRRVADVFRPVCYLTGRCEFAANFDRPCRIRDRVVAHAEKGEPSSEWADISPAEWLADPAAAR